MAKSKSQYKSFFEECIAKDLHKSKVPFLYEPWTLQYFRRSRNAKCLDCKSKNVVDEHTYLPDFVSVDGMIVVEAKGNFTPPMRTKMIEVIRNNPNIQIRMLFQCDNWLTKKYKSRYSDWCKQKKITYAVGMFPTEWKAEFRKAKRGMQ